MGRVNLDQLDMIKDQGSSAEEEEEEEERETMEMVSDGKVALEEEEEEAEEENDDNDVGMEIIENMVEGQTEMDDEEMEENVKDEDDEVEEVEEVEDEEDEEEVQEVGEGKPAPQGNVISKELLFYDWPVKSKTLYYDFKKTNKLDYKSRIDSLTKITGDHSARDYVKYSWPMFVLYIISCVALWSQ